MKVERAKMKKNVTALSRRIETIERNKESEEEMG